VRGLVICTFLPLSHQYLLCEYELRTGLDWIVANYWNRRSIICGTRRRRGAIYLEDEDTLFVVKKPFYLQPAPPPRYKNSSPSSLQNENWDSDTDTEVEGYDSDAYEKV
jgi:hypothetical protein